MARKNMIAYREQPLCVHNAAQTLFHKDGKEIRIANKYGLSFMACRPACVVDLANVVGTLDFVLPGSDERFEELRLYVHRPQLLRLAWEDMSVPPVGLEFWSKLWDLLPQGITVITCFGGHGRSGTALAALLIANGFSAMDAIDYVRTVHCNLAIETLEQEEYLARLR